MKDQAQYLDGFGGQQLEVGRGPAAYARGFLNRHASYCLRPQGRVRRLHANLQAGYVMALNYPTKVTPLSKVATGVGSVTLPNLTPETVKSLMQFRRAAGDKFLSKFPARGPDVTLNLNQVGGSRNKAAGDTVQVGRTWTPNVSMRGEAVTGNTGLSPWDLHNWHVNGTRDHSERGMGGRSHLSETFLARGLLAV